MKGNQEIGNRGIGGRESWDRSSRGYFLIPSNSASPVPMFVILVGVLLLAAWLRWHYLMNVQPYPDEFVTLLAVRMILQKGVPVLPSGLFYEHGLLFSYAGAAAAELLGFSREAVRGISLVFGVLTVALTWHVGRRWYSRTTGLLAATLLAVAPTAVLWAGRARMYALLQLLVLLSLYFVFSGALDDCPVWRRLALVCYLAATLTHFVAIALIPPLVIATVVVGWYGARRRRETAWFRSHQVWLEGAGLAVVALVAFLVKRAGQPKGVSPLELTSTGVAAGIKQVVAIYGGLPTDLAGSWAALAPFFTAPEAILPAALALVAAGWAVTNLLRRRLTRRDVPTLFLALILAMTTLEMVLLVSPERRDEKYLFMLQPALFLLAADGLTRLGNRILSLKPQASAQHAGARVSTSKFPASSWWFFVFSLVACLALVAYAWPATWDLVSRTGPDYDTAFAYVRDHWGENDAVLTGTPAAAAFYLNRNDYYAVRGTGGYAYRILEQDGQKVDRWMGSPWLETDAQVHSVLQAYSPVWLVLERWGLINEYYSPLTMQRLLAMTEFVREDDGIIVLRSRQTPRLIPEVPTVPLSANFDNQLRLDGYHLDWRTADDPAVDGHVLELVLYWQALQPVPYDYTVFVHLRDAAGRNVAQGDHQPLAPVYPPTLWPAGQTIRERSLLVVPEDVPAGSYDLWIGLYRLDTLERLPLLGDSSGENALRLGQVTVP